MGALTYLGAWQSISARIHGLEKAATLHASFLAANPKSIYGADKALQSQCEGVLSALKDFRSAYHAALPSPAVAAIERFLDDGGKQIEQNGSGDAALVRTIIVKVVAMESEVSFGLYSPTERLRSAAELAFIHLQRLIVADPEHRKKWQEAYAAGELTCEGLGAVHLLWHGIWAFKTDAAGAKTDLIYQEPLQATNAASVAGLVLTEWKKAKANSAAKFQEAKRQAELYSSGVLAGIELASHRYLIVVTEKETAIPPDVVEQGIIYRHINICVNPRTPSAMSPIGRSP